MPDNHSDLINETSSRRNFLKRAAVTAIAGGAVAACKESSAQKTPLPASNTTKPVAAPAMSAAEAMDKMHEAGIKAFPAKTAGKGNQPLAARIEKGVKVF